MQNLAQSSTSARTNHQLSYLSFSPQICSSCMFLYSTQIPPFQKSWTWGTCRCTLVETSERWFWKRKTQTTQDFPRWLFFSLPSSLLDAKIKLKFHRMAKVGRDHWRFSTPTSAQAGFWRALYPGLCPDHFWVSPGKEICPSLGSPTNPQICQEPSGSYLSPHSVLPYSLKLHNKVQSHTYKGDQGRCNSWLCHRGWEQLAWPASGIHGHNSVYHGLREERNHSFSSQLVWPHLLLTNF